MKLPVDEDTVLLGDSLFGGCGGSVLELSGDLDFDCELGCFTDDDDDFDFDSTDERESDDDFVFEFDLIELLRERDAEFDDFDADFLSESVSLFSLSLFVELVFEEELPLVAALPNRE